MVIKIKSTYTHSLTVGKEYKVEDFRVNTNDENEFAMLIGCDVIDDDGDLYTIVNFDEAEYEVVKM
ncbi:hypothetical protein [Cytobacillus gottheilii]|uniref:hypothetical protein n=1 Tax=Cytobacillus gottheilii TaxID=859144 RepID=UPI0009BA4B4A|nr:hypothetical protein [Cytobacillus gottheilii]